MVSTADQNRVVVTGMGVVSPLGLNVADTWAGLVAGRSGIGPITQFDASEFPCRICASVKGFDATAFMDVKEARRSAPLTHYVVAALMEAKSQAGLDFTQLNSARLGISLGTALGGVSFIEEQVNTLRTAGVRRVNPTLLPAVLVNMPACYIGIMIGAKGPVRSPTAACATGVVAIGEGYRLMRRGEVDVMIVGGTESPLTPIGIACFGRLGALSAKNDDPENACRPFDKLRDGTIVGEGASVLVLETLAHARRRGVKPLAEIVGFGETGDAYHVVMPEPSGEGAARAMKSAMEEAGWVPDDVDYICAHGTGTPLNDVAETKAIKLALGETAAHQTLISANKSMVGHMLGAAGAFSAVVTVKTITEGLVTPTANLRNPDPECDLDYVPVNSRPANVRCALVNAFGFGGQNATLALQAIG